MMWMPKGFSSTSKSSSRVTMIRASGCQCAGQIRVILRIAAPLFAQRRRLNTLHVVLIPGYGGGHRMRGLASAIGQKIAQLLQGFLGGIGNHPALRQGQQTSMRFPPPSGAGKNNPRVKDDLDVFSSGGF
jgi:hypothetical protein